MRRLAIVLSVFFLISSGCRAEDPEPESSDSVSQEAETGATSEEDRSTAFLGVDSFEELAQGAETIGRDLVVDAEAAGAELGSAAVSGADVIAAALADSGLSFENGLQTAWEVYRFSCSPGQLKNEILIPLLRLGARCQGLLCRYARSLGFQRFSDVPMTSLDPATLAALAIDHADEDGLLAMDLGTYLLLSTLKLGRCSVPLNPVGDVPSCLKTSIFDQIYPLFFLDGVFHLENASRLARIDFGSLGDAAYRCMQDSIDVSDVAMQLEENRLSSQCLANSSTE